MTALGAKSKRNDKSKAADELDLQQKYCNWHAWFDRDKENYDDLGSFTPLNIFDSQGEGAPQQQKM